MQFRYSKRKYCLGAQYCSKAKAKKLFLVYAQTALAVAISGVLGIDRDGNKATVEQVEGGVLSVRYLRRAGTPSHFLHLVIAPATNEAESDRLFYSEGDDILVRFIFPDAIFSSLELGAIAIKLLWPLLCSLKTGI
ncbi:hypothetical protein [Nostoc sp.]